MNIIADKAIPGVSVFFSRLGDIELCDESEITPSRVRDADVLLVRSVTRVDQELLQDSRVACVATATSGYDHVDTAYLQEINTGFVYAGGCNARSVAEYVLSSLMVLADRDGFDLADKTVGIIGCGHVGSAVSNLLGSIGISCLIHDPPLQAAGDNRYTYVGLDEVLAADIVTVHVPLQLGGAYPTRHLVGQKFLAALRTDAILINTSRGEVIDEGALAEFLTARRHATVVLDVWQNEPLINVSLLSGVALATPHIAGYSIDGKVRATKMIYQQVCRYFGKPDDANLLPDLLPASTCRLDIADYHNDAEVIQKAVLGGYDVRTDDGCLRRILDVAEAKRGEYFSQLRNNYPVRREFTALNICLPHATQTLRGRLMRLGFRIED